MLSAFHLLSDTLHIDHFIQEYWRLFTEYKLGVSAVLGMLQILFLILTTAVQDEVVHLLLTIPL